MNLRLLTRLACVLLACAAGACRRDAGRTELVVFAAASLREPFVAIAGRFEQQHPGTSVLLNTAGSQQLALQLEHGAAADVFASADPDVLQRLARGGHVEAPQAFARNELVIVVQKGNPRQITGLADLPAVDRLVLAAPEVPVGRYARELLTRAEAELGEGFAQAVEAKARSGELSARQVLARVALGEADAGIVYRTDVSASPEVEAVEVPAFDVVATYEIAIPSGAPHRQGAVAFVELVRSEQGSEILRQHGFLSAPGTRP